MGLLDVITPRLTELGKIKIGGLGDTKTSSSGATFRQPEKHDYFTVTTLHRDGKGNLITDAAVMESLASLVDHDGKLRQLPVYLLSNDPEDIMQAAWCWYRGKRLAGRSDGVNLTLYFNGGKWLPKPQVVPWRESFTEQTDSQGNRLYKLHSTFNCVIAASSTKFGGVHKFRTTSGITASQLLGSLLQLRQLTSGQLRGLPLRLVVRPLQVSPGGKATTVYVVHVELQGTDLGAIQELALERAKFEVENVQRLREIHMEYKKLVQGPAEGETAEEQAEIAAEFQPESVDDGETDATSAAGTAGGEGAGEGSLSGRDGILLNIAGATTVESLKLVGEEIKAMLGDGRLTAEDNEVIKPQYKAKKVALEATPAVVVPPVTPDPLATTPAVDKFVAAALAEDGQPISARDPVAFSQPTGNTTIPTPDPTSSPVPEKVESKS